jgi:hypothetical protein
VDGVGAGGGSIAAVDLLRMGHDGWTGLVVAAGQKSKGLPTGGVALEFFGIG